MTLASSHRRAKDCPPSSAGNDQWRPGLVDQDGIRFVNNAKIVIPLNLILFAGRHSIVPQVVESEFGSGAVSMLRSYISRPEDGMLF